MEFKAFGDNCLLIEFEQKIDPLINTGISHLRKSIEKAEIPGIRFFIPAYASLTIGYDPLRITFDDLCKRIRSLKVEKTTQQSQRKLTIPVCYDDSFAPDILSLSEQCALSKNEVIRLHTATVFQVFMLGFLPGFPYMGKLPESLFCQRKTQPRVNVPAGAVGLAGFQTGIYPSEAPGGWQLIGRTPLKLFDLGKLHPFLFRPGDQVRFQAISISDFRKIEKDIASGQFNDQMIYD